MWSTTPAAKAESGPADEAGKGAVKVAPRPIPVPASSESKGGLRQEEASSSLSSPSAVVKSPLNAAAHPGPPLSTLPAHQESPTRATARSPQTRNVSTANLSFDLSLPKLHGVQGAAESDRDWLVDLLEETFFKIESGFSSIAAQLEDRVSSAELKASAAEKHLKEMNRKYSELQTEVQRLKVLGVEKDLASLAQRTEGFQKELDILKTNEVFTLKTELLELVTLSSKSMLKEGKEREAEVISKEKDIGISVQTFKDSLRELEQKISEQLISQSIFSLRAAELSPAQRNTCLESLQKQAKERTTRSLTQGVLLATSAREDKQTKASASLRQQVEHPTPSPVEIEPTVSVDV